jgi:hypothetical protein
MLPIQLLLLTVPALAGVQVNGTGTVYTTISQALAAASAGDTLHVGAGSYTESVVIDKDLTLRGPDVGIATWFGGSGPEILLVEPTVELTLEKLDLRGDSADQRVLTAEGDNTLVLDEVDLESDSASDGGVLYLLEPSSLTIRSSRLEGTSAGEGGAVYAYSSSPFPLLVEDTAFYGISDSSGGSLWLQYAELTCTRCTFEGSAGLVGGAIYALSGELDLSQSLFCRTEAAAGGALYANTDVAIRSSRFVETSATATGGALQMLSGSWTVENNHFLGIAASSSSGALEITSGQTAIVRNNLFFEHEGYGIHRINGTHTTRYNWFESSAGSVANYALDATNERYSPGDPLLLSWTRDGDCSDDQLWPTPLLSPLLDAGDPAVLDPDGSVSDIGAYGGPDADPTFHSDSDADGGLFFRDCDDADPLRSEDLDELCDNVDNDCDDLVDESAIDMRHFYEDCDGDGQGDPLTELAQCDWPAPPACGGQILCLECTGASAQQDCDDTDPGIYLGAEELCDPEDRDCDGDPTDGASDAVVYFQDADADGYGGAALSSCSGRPDGFVSVEGDCADLDPNVNPAQLETCNGLDDDCNGVMDDAGAETAWYPDADGDGYGDQHLPVMSSCSPGEGWLERGGDCDDTDAEINPDQPERCNGLDDDCNGLFDDGPLVSWLPDEDGDGYGDDSRPQETSCPPETATSEGGDCDDTSAEVHPGATEVCNGLDDDCSQGVDNLDTSATWYRDDDGDGLGNESQTLQAPCTPGPGWVALPGDCDDLDPSAGSECQVGCGCQQAPHRPGLALLLGLLLATFQRRVRP